MLVKVLILRDIEFIEEIGVSNEQTGEISQIAGSNLGLVLAKVLFKHNRSGVFIARLLTLLNHKQSHEGPQQREGALAELYSLARVEVVFVVLG